MESLGILYRRMNKISVNIQISIFVYLKFLLAYDKPYYGKTEKDPYKATMMRNLQLVMDMKGLICTVWEQGCHV
jgi:hypothetical protein